MDQEVPKQFPVRHGAYSNLDRCASFWKSRVEVGAAFRLNSANFLGPRYIGPKILNLK